MRATRMAGTAIHLTLDEAGTAVESVRLTLGRNTLDFEIETSPVESLIEDLVEKVGTHVSNDRLVMTEGDVDLLHQDGTIKALILFVGSDAIGAVPKALEGSAEKAVATLLADRGSYAAGDYQLPPSFTLSADEPTAEELEDEITPPTPDEPESDEPADPEESADGGMGHSEPEDPDGGGVDADEEPQGNPGSE